MSIHATQASPWLTQTTLTLPSSSTAAASSQGRLVWGDENGEIYTTTLVGQTVPLYSLGQYVAKIAEIGNNILVLAGDIYQTSLYLIDPEQKKTVAQLDQVFSFTLTGGKLWALLSTSKLQELDSSNLSVLKTIELATNQLTALGSCLDKLVVSDNATTVEVYDPNTGGKTFEFPITSSVGSLITSNFDFIAIGTGCPAIAPAGLQFWNTHQNTPFMKVPQLPPTGFVFDILNAKGSYFVATATCLQLRAESPNFEVISTPLQTPVNQLIEVDVDTIVASLGNQFTVFRRKLENPSSTCSVM